MQQKFENQMKPFHKDSVTNVYCIHLPREFFDFGYFGWDLIICGYFSKIAKVFCVLKKNFSWEQVDTYFR